MEPNDFTYLQNTQSSISMSVSGVKQPETEILLSAPDSKPLSTFFQVSFQVLNENTCKVLA